MKLFSKDTNNVTDIFSYINNQDASILNHIKTDIIGIDKLDGSTVTNYIDIQDGSIKTFLEKHITDVKSKIDISIQSLQDMDSSLDTSINTVISLLNSSINNVYTEFNSSLINTSA